MMSGHWSMHWPHLLLCPFCNEPSWSSTYMPGIWTESAHQLSSTMIVVSMSSMHSCSMTIDLISTLTNESREEVARILDQLPVPHSSKAFRSATHPTSCPGYFMWVVFSRDHSHKNSSKWLHIIIFVELRLGRSISFVVHSAVGLQWACSATDSRQEDQPISSLATTWLISESRFISSRMNGLDLQWSVTHSHSISDHVSGEHRRAVSRLLWSRNRSKITSSASFVCARQPRCIRSLFVNLDEHSIDHHCTQSKVYTMHISKLECVVYSSLYASPTVSTCGSDWLAYVCGWSELSDHCRDSGVVRWFFVLFSNVLGVW